MGADTGIEHIEDFQNLNIPPFKEVGFLKELVDVFGGKPAYLRAIHELQDQLYSSEISA